MTLRGDSESLERERERKISTLRRKEEEERTQELAQKLGFAYEDLSMRNLDAEALLTIPEEQARAAHALVIQKTGKRLTLAVTNPQNPAFVALEKELESRRYSLNRVLISPTSFAYASEAFRRFAKAKQKITGELRLTPARIKKIEQTIWQTKDVKTTIAHIQETDASAFVEVFLAGALKLNASDVHVEPEEKGAKIRYRLDGVLHDVGTLSLRSYKLILSRLKLLAGMKLNIKKTAQDGRFTIVREGKEIEIRASALPGEYGEYIVLRVLNPQALLSLGELGIRRDLVTIVETELRRTQGMLLTTGPTGSGKSTALYAFLKHVITPELKIITVEDPIEYHLSGIEQTQVDPGRGYTFANALRSIVRQDPDIILVGEIRDHETANIALHAGLTGQLVFATLHTNDAAGAFPRLIDLGLNPQIIAPVLNLVLAQRLVRKLCEHCSRTYRPAPKEQTTIRAALATVPQSLIKPLWKTPLTLRKARGCQECYFTGFRERIGLFELFLVDNVMKGLLLKAPSTIEVREAAIKRGMVTVQQDGILKALAHITSIQEVERVTGPLQG